MHGVACTISWACSCAYSCIPRHIYLSRTSRGINCDHSKVDDRRHAQPPRLVCVPSKHASWIKWWFVLEPWKCVVEFSKRGMLSWNFEGKRNGVAKKGEKKLGGGFSVERSCSSGWTAGWRPDDRDQRHLSRHLRGDKENSRTTVGRAG